MKLWLLLNTISPQLRAAGTDVAWSNWVQITPSTPWTNRESSFIGTLNDGSLVVFGGAGGKDVWSSTDFGNTWTQKTAHAPWAPRSKYCTLINPTTNDIWLFGGNKHGFVSQEVWRSSDGGAHWAPATFSAEYGARTSMVCTSIGNVLLVGSGELSDGTLMADLWKSTSGSSWVLVTGNPSWPSRTRAWLVSASDGSIVLGGGTPGLGGKFNDVWRSIDGGVSWIQQVEFAPWYRRNYAAALHHNGTIYMVGGKGGSWFSDVWGSTDLGINWALLLSTGPWGAVTFPSVTVNNERGVLLGFEAGSMWATLPPSTHTTNTTNTTNETTTFMTTTTHLTTTMTSRAVPPTTSTLYSNVTTNSTTTFTTTQTSTTSTTATATATSTLWSTVTSTTTYMTTATNLTTTMTSRAVSPTTSTLDRYVTTNSTTTFTTTQTSTTSTTATAIATSTISRTVTSTTTYMATTVDFTTVMTSTLSLAATATATSSLSSTFMQSSSSSGSICDSFCQDARRNVDKARHALATVAVEDSAAVVVSVKVHNFDVQLLFQKFSSTRFSSSMHFDLNGASVDLPAGFGAHSSTSFAVAIIAWNGTESLDGRSGAAQGWKLGVQPLQIDVTTSNDTGDPLEITSLPEPMKLEMPIINNTAPSADMELVCVYWDPAANQWSREGVRTISQVNGSRITCETSHLSVFAAVWSSMVLGVTCANLKIFSSQGFQLLAGEKLPGTQHWYEHPSGMTVLILFMSNVVFIVGAICKDVSHSSGTDWGPEDFLIESPVVPPKKGLVDMTVDAIMSSVVLANAAAEAKIDCEDMMLAVEHQTHIAQHCRSNRKSHITSSAPVANVQRGQAKLLRTHGLCTSDTAVVQLLEQTITETRFLGRMLKLAINSMPLLRIWHYSVVFTHLSRVLLLSCSMWGALMGSCLFFSTSGNAVSLDSPAACAASAIPVVTAITSGVLTAIFSQLAVLVCTIFARRTISVAAQWTDEAKHKTIRRWKAQQVLTDTFMVFFVAFSMLFVCLFLAHVTDVDRAAWVISACMSILKMFLIQPWLMAGTLALMIRVGSISRIERLWVTKWLEASSEHSESMVPSSMVKERAADNAMNGGVDNEEREREQKKDLEDEQQNLEEEKDPPRQAEQEEETTQLEFAQQAGSSNCQEEADGVKIPTETQDARRDPAITHTITVQVVSERLCCDAQHLTSGESNFSRCLQPSGILRFRCCSNG